MSFKTVTVKWVNIKDPATAVNDELEKYRLEGYNFVENITLGGKVGCLLVFYLPSGTDYEDAEPLTTDPNEIEVSTEPDSLSPPHTK